MNLVVRNLHVINSKKGTPFPLPHAYVRVCNGRVHRLPDLGQTKCERRVVPRGRCTVSGRFFSVYGSSLDVKYPRFS